MRDKKLTIEPDSLLFPIIQIAETVRAEKTPVEPAKDGSTASPFVTSDAGLRSVLRDLDSNQDTLLQRQMSYH